MLNLQIKYIVFIMYILTDISMTVNIVGETSVGSIQYVEFNESISFTPSNAACTELFNGTAAQFGTGARCQRVDSNMKVRIKYGENPSAGNLVFVTIDSGFNSVAITGTFNRSPIPKFELSENAITAYLDYEATISIINSIFNVQTNMEYKWKYVGGSSISGNLTTKTLNYWEMSPEEYNIEITLKDNDNSYFKYILETGAFTVQESCSASCGVVEWRTTGNPGACGTGCISGHRTNDEFDITLSGSNPYITKLAYRTDSQGGRTLTMDSDNHLHTSTCGSNVKLPSVAVVQDSPASCRSSYATFTISYTFSNNGLASSGYSLDWVQPAGSTPCTGTSCLIDDARGLADGGPYTFKSEITLTGCTGVWMSASFAPFRFYAQTDPITTSMYGSVQTITLPGAATLAVAGAGGCSDLLSTLSLDHLGTHAECLLATPTTINIKFGNDTVAGSRTIALNPLAILPCFEGSVSRGILPKFTINIVGGSIPGYQDNSAVFKADSIVNEGSAPLTYNWSYIDSPATGSKPDLSSHNTAEYTFNYFNLDPGNFTIKLMMKDPANTHFSYEAEGTFEILPNSCDTNCDRIIWKFSNDPGTCAANCATGSNPTDDVIVYTHSAGGPPYILTATYQPGSKGGNDLTIIPALNNNLNTKTCGDNIKFPWVDVDEDGIDMLASKLYETFSGTIDPNGLILDTDFKKLWVVNGVDNLTDTHTYTITPYSLVLEQNYQYDLVLKMICQGGSASPWTKAAFAPFKYYEIGIINGVVTATETEIDKITSYSFVIRPNYTFPMTAVFEITFPDEIKVGDSGGGCTSDIGTTCIIAHTIPHTIVRVSDLLTVDYTDMAANIAFSVSPVTNPEVTYPFTDFLFDVKTWRHDLLIVYHESNLTFSNTGRFSPHHFANTQIEWGSTFTATQTYYKFNFTNTGYVIPTGATLRVEFPSTLSFVDVNPTLSDIINLEPTKTAAFESSGSNDNILIINNGFDNLGAESTIEFKVNNMLNPYEVGNSPPFNIYIYINITEYKIFIVPISIEVPITTIAEFPSFIVGTPNLITSSTVAYHFELEVGDRGFLPSLLIEFQIPQEVQQCYEATFAPLDASLIIGTTYHTATAGNHNYSFVVGGTLAPHSILKFQIDCVNPYTNRGILDIFQIWGLKDTGEAFYYKTGTFTDMITYNTFTELNITAEVIYPRALCKYSFHIITSSPRITREIDEIIIVVSPALNLTHYSEGAHSNISGSLIFTQVGQIITISGISELHPIFEFELVNVRNPLEKIEDIYYRIMTHHSDGYYGENTTSTITHTNCDFPCRNCLSAQPSECAPQLSPYDSGCFPQGDEVFQDGGVQLYLNYLEDALVCLDACPSHTYNDTMITCLDCDIKCSECLTFDTRCIKCYTEVDLYLYQWDCINPCPTLFGGKKATWSCVGNSAIYIYIYI